MADLNCSCLRVSYTTITPETGLQTIQPEGLYEGYNYFELVIGADIYFLWLDFDAGSWYLSETLGDIGVLYAIYTSPTCPTGEWDVLLDPFVSITISEGICGSLECGCPSGYSLNSLGICEKVTEDDVIRSGTIYNSSLQDPDVEYSIYGAFIFEEITDRPFPIAQTQVGVTDAVETKDFLTEEVDIVQILPNLPWKNRLSNTGIWTTISPLPANQWIGFTFCIDTDEERIYYIGFGSTTHLRIKLNDQVIYLSNHINTPGYKRWQILPIKFPTGINNVIIEGRSIGGTPVFGAEIYDCTFSQLTTATTLNISSYIVASTADRDESSFDTGETSGNSCSVGFHLENCSEDLLCIKREFIDKQPCCNILINCQNPSEHIHTNVDLEEFVGKIVNVQLYPGCWEVTTSDLPCVSVQEVEITASFDSCEECIPIDEVCYTLVNCKDEEETLKVKGPFSGYINQFVRIEGFEGCWKVELSLDACIPVVEVDIIDYFSSCTACLKEDNCKPKKCCDE